MNKNNLKTAGRQSLAVAFAFLMVTSMVLMPIGAVGVASAQDESSEDTTQAVVCEPINGDWWSLLSLDVKGTLSSVYCSASGVFGSPHDYTNDVRQSEDTYVVFAQMAETHEQMVTDWQVDRDTYQVTAFSDAEQAVIEARYNDESDNVALSDARSAINAHYANTGEMYYEGHNNLWTDYYVWSRGLDRVATIDEQMTVSLGEYSTSSSNARATLTAQEESELVRENITLYNGEQMEVVTRITDVRIEDVHETGLNRHIMQDGYDPDAYDTVDLVFANDDNVRDSRMGIVFYDDAGDVVDSYDNNVDIRTHMRMDDPNTDGSSTISLTGDGDAYHVNRIYHGGLNDDRVDTLTDAESIQTNWYAEVGAGEVSPEEYYGPREFYQDYGSAMDTSVAAQLYMHMTVGYDAAPDMTMIVDDSNAGALEGGVLVDSAVSAPLVYDDTPLPLTSNGDVTLDSHAHEGVFIFDDETNETSITFVDGSDYDTEDISIDVLNVDNETVSVDGANVTATFSEGDLQDDDFVIFRAVHDDGETVSESGTFVLFSEENIEEVRGFVTGDEYSGYDMLYLTGSGDIDRTTLSNSWVLEENYDAAGDAKAVAVTDTGVNTDFRGTTAWDRIDDQQAIQDAIDNRDDIQQGAGGGAGDDGISPFVTGLIGLFGGVFIVVGIGFVLVVLYLVGRVTSIA